LKTIEKEPRKRKKTSEHKRNISSPQQKISSYFEKEEISKMANNVLAGILVTTSCLAYTL